MVQGGTNGGTRWYWVLIIVIRARMMLLRVLIIVIRARMMLLRVLIIVIRARMMLLRVLIALGAAEQGAAEYTYRVRPTPFVAFGGFKREQFLCRMYTWHAARAKPRESAAALAATRCNTGQRAATWPSRSRSRSAAAAAARKRTSPRDDCRRCDATRCRTLSPPPPRVLRAAGMGRPSQ